MVPYLGSHVEADGGTHRRMPQDVWDEAEELWANQ